MERSQLKYVVEVAKWQNITRAAEVLHITQPSLSNQIISLERELGVSLFERSRKRVKLTEAGESFVYQATGILNEMDGLKQSMADFAKRHAGTVRVGALSVMVSLGIPDVLIAFTDRYPALRVTLTEEDSHSLIGKVNINELDAVFATPSDADAKEDLYQVKLAESRIVAAVNAGHPLARRSELTLEDLRDQKLVITSESFNIQRRILTLLDHMEIPYQVTAACNQIDTCFRLVDKGFGISFCSEEASGYYSYRNVRYVPVLGVDSRPLCLIYKKNPAYYPALQSFVTFVTDYYRAKSPTGVLR